MTDNAQPVEVKNDKQLAEDFVKSYEALCDAHKMRVVAVPTFKARDDGTFSVVVQMSVGKLPQA